MAPVELEQKFENFDRSKINPPPPLKPSLAATPPYLPVTTPPPATNSAPSAKAASAKTSKKKNKTPVASNSATPTPPLAPASAAEAPTWTPSGWPYGVGEKVTWVLRYGPLEGGIATLSVEEPQVLEGEPVLHYQGLVKSSKVLEWFYKIDNEINTWVRMADHLPLRQEIKQLESARWGRRVVVFDQATNKAKFFSSLTKSDGNKEEVLREDAITPYAQDIFSSLYFFRFIDPKQTTKFPIHDRWKNWSNDVTYLNDETISTPAGQFECSHYKLLPRVDGALEPKGDVEIWVSNQKEHLIVKFTAKIKVGALTGELRSFEPGRPLDLPLPRLKTPLK
ncbi:MAG: DUF3108 domain-containing protein [Bdellovibrionales bacterium]|nr:DUF3108 domain-containing protein [Bdellovibrionales bacterium]